MSADEAAPSREKVKRLALRASITKKVRAFFEAREFLEVETPLLVPSPGLDLHLDAFAVDGRFLATSPEYQMKRLLAEGHLRIFQLGKAFRRGESGHRHNPEFTLLEWYRAHAQMEDVMADTEALLRAVAPDGFDLPVTLRGEPPTTRHVPTDIRFERLPVAAAFERFAGITEDETLRLAESDEDGYFRLLVERVEPAIAAFECPVFLTRYPATQASLARHCDDDPRFAERFELYVAGVELCNGFGELTDPVEQRARFAEDQRERQSRGLPVYPIDERLIAALVKGLPPSAGNALGFDRLVALTAGTLDIRDVLAFPWDET